MLVIPSCPASTRRHIVDAASPSSGLAAAICPGDSPRRGPSRIAAISAAAVASVSSMPRRAPESSASAARRAVRASQRTFGPLGHPWPGAWC